MKLLKKVFQFLFLIANIVILINCGGGEGRNDSGQQPATAAACLGCHSKDIQDTHYDLSTTHPIEGYVLENAISWAKEGIG